MPNKDPIIDFESMLQNVDSEADITFYLQSSILIEIPYVEIRECIVFYQGEIASFIDSYQNSFEYQLEIINKNVLAVRLTRQINKESLFHGCFCIQKTPYKNIFRIITVSRGDFWNNALIPFIKSHYPKIAFLHFTNNEIEQALLSFENKLLGIYVDKFHLEITENTRKTKRLLEPKKEIKIIDTERSWTRTSITDLFIELKERGFWTTSLKFRIDISKRHRNLFTAYGKINKKGAFSCTGLYNEIRPYLIDQLERFAVERMKLLEYRGIEERDFQPGPPLEILFDDDVFINTEKVREFGGAINHYQSASIVVYHGNPYYHASIADTKDGSSFELWVLSRRRILISPQTKSTVQALSRIITFIFERFKEGNVSEYKPTTD
jgi:hypothetical protein